MSASAKRSVPMDQARPTLRDVAKMAGGVHPSTVSLAMRNHPGISEALRKRIKAAAKDLGYRPDPLLDAFNNHRVAVQPHRSVSTLAWVVEAATRKDLVEHAFYGPMWVGAQKAAEFFHCQLELFFLGGNQLSPSRLNTVLKTRGITGVVCVDIRGDRETLDLDWPSFSSLRVESQHLPAPKVGLSADQKQAVRLAVSKLREAGAVRLGLALAGGANGAVLEAQRTAWAFERYSAEPGLLPAPFEVGDSTPFEVRRWAKGAGLDAIILNDHRILYPPQRSDFREATGLRVACLDAAQAPLWVGGCVIDAQALGSQAVEQAVTLMRNNQRGNPETAATTYLPMTWRNATLPQALS